MRGRSSTVSRTRTRSVSFSARLALVLVINRGPTLESLPTEILLEIIRIAATLPASRDSNKFGGSTSTGSAHRLVDDDSSNNSDLVLVKNLNTLPRLDRRTLRTLALTSRILSGLAHTILYAHVSLTSTKLATLYARTVIDCAHRDITLVSTTSPVSPTSPTCSAFNDIPALFAGKFTNRLSIEYPFHDYSPRAMKTRNTIAEVERFHAASGALLGIGQSAPSVQSPVLASLRTLVIDSCILEHHLRQHATLSSSSSSSSSPSTSSFAFPFVSPTPSELILHSYISWNPSSPSSFSPLAPLSAHLTHLIVAAPPQKWTLPSTTLSALGGAPNLTYLALVRRANANEDNDEDFVLDVERILSERAGQLKNLVLVIVPDSGFSAWKDSQAPVSESDEDEAMEDEEGFDDSIRTLSAYLSRTHIWCRLSSLISQVTATTGTKVNVSLIPGTSSAWTRALHLSSKEGAIFSSNIFHSAGDAGANHSDKDLWRWSRRFETWRRSRQSKERGLPLT
ncbi:uncharacterized protein FOMMEDRAFT_16772 [Fomitiporia mediterranea MF3/22]|uniref:uncharacterized protein n=1 Tax=Fomitiporia mediterranea (strain MF3/22) TaxID=694068 RepID=UPI00044078BA|nr:uncharacterized protein FOMMEDRAFT_16772 [Fomitiporia mediterranea MF3/22]EJD08384.1 hypothetical protein FOMMEDRAFT_16772 [Fomitiporia mediterranea MF3/22]